MIILLAGLPGSGKSTLARELTSRTDGRVLSKDEIRHALFLPQEIEYSSRQDDFCVRVMLAWRILECVCSEETAKQRLETESASSVHRAGNRDYKLYLELRARFEAITMPKTVIDTDQPLEVCVRQALAALR